MANKHIVRERNTGEEDASKEVMPGARGEVVSSIMADISEWRKLRDETFEDLWNEFYRKWRGFWAVSDRSAKSERSKLISPLTSMAVDLSVAEIVEAVLGREHFVDLPDDVEDAEKADMDAVRVRFTQDMRNEDFDLNFPMAALNAALYGTGIMKLQILTKKVRTLVRGKEGELLPSEDEIVHIKPVSVDPSQFVPDPGAIDIDDMKGCAHEFPLPLHIIEQRQEEGIYYKDVEVGPYSAWTTNGTQRSDTERGDNLRMKRGSALITEYYGLVPTREFLRAVADGTGQEIPAEDLFDVDRGAMTEVIATIANETHLLRVIENPNVTGERLFVSYQHESVPARFWGRGVAEKAANVQRAMDAEMRARIDALAWSNGPMFAGDLTRMPPGANLNAWPGKFWGTRGNPSEVLQAFKTPGPDAASFNHMADLERMGQQATGALDSIMSLRSGVRDETATGSALSASGFIKRSKRTMRNVESFLNKLVKRCIHLKMRFDPERYPTDYNFQVRGTLGMMAREIEQQHLTNLMQTLGADSPHAGTLLIGILEHSSIPNKEALKKAIEAQLNRKPSPEEEAARNAALEKPVLENEEIKATIEKLRSEAGLKGAQAQTEVIEAKIKPTQNQIEIIRAANDLEETQNQVRQLDLLQDKNDIEREKIKLQARKPSK